MHDKLGGGGIMKKYVLALLCVFGFASFGMAQSSSVALKMGFPLLFSIGYGHDFEAPNKGLGVRAYFGGTALGSSGYAGIGVEGVMRAPLGEYGSSAALGLGMSGLLVTGFGGTPLTGVGGGSTAGPTFGAYIYLLAALEITLGSNWGLLLEWQPLQVAFGAGNVQFSTIPFLALGVNYRF
jgi:hypothetical protein